MRCYLERRLYDGRLVLLLKHLHLYKQKKTFNVYSLKSGFIKYSN